MNDPTEISSEAVLRRHRGKTLRQARKEKGLSARTLVKQAIERSMGALDLSKEAIYAYESGRVLLSEDVAAHLAPVLGVSARELLVVKKTASKSELAPSADLILAFAVERADNLRTMLLFLATELALEVGPHATSAYLHLEIAKRIRDQVRGWVSSAQEFRRYCDKNDMAEQVFDLAETMVKWLTLEVIETLEGSASRPEEEIRGRFRTACAQVRDMVRALDDCLATSDATAAVSRGGSKGASKTGHRAIVVVDLVNYSHLAQVLNLHLGTEGVVQLHQQILGLMIAALDRVKRKPNDALVCMTGDGAILAFDDAVEAVRFSQALQEFTDEHNTGKEEASQRHFRIGVAAGTIIVQPAFGGIGAPLVAGAPIVEAVRLAGACMSGCILVSKQLRDIVHDDVGFRVGYEDGGVVSAYRVRISVEDR